MRALIALVASLVLVVIAMAELGEFGPTDQRAAAPAAQTADPERPVPTPTVTPTGPGTVTLTFTEQDLTKAAADHTPLTVSGITVSDPRIRLEPGRLTLTATGRAFIVSGRVVVVATPLVADGKAAAKIESATFAGFALSDSTKRDVADTFARVLAANIPAGAKVTAVTVNAGTLVVLAVPA